MSLCDLRSRVQKRFNLLSLRRGICRAGFSSFFITRDVNDGKLYVLKTIFIRTEAMEKRMLLAAESLQVRVWWLGRPPRPRPHIDCERPLPAPPPPSPTPTPSVWWRLLQFFVVVASPAPPPLPTHPPAHTTQAHAFLWRLHALTEHYSPTLCGRRKSRKAAKAWCAFRMCSSTGCTLQADRGCDEGTCGCSCDGVHTVYVQGACCCGCCMPGTGSHAF
jgi:hypothetical protein